MGVTGNWTSVSVSICDNTVVCAWECVCLSVSVCDNTVVWAWECVWLWASVMIQLCERESVCDCERVWWYSCVSVRVCVIVSVCDDTVVWAWECVWVWACVIQLWAWECVWLWTCEIQLCERESVCECERVSVNCKNSVCTNVTVILCGYVGVCAWVWQREHVCVCVWASLNPRNVRRLQSNTQYSQFRKAVQILSVKSVR